MRDYEQEIHAAHDAMTTAARERRWSDAKKSSQLLDELWAERIAHDKTLPDEERLAAITEGIDKLTSTEFRPTAWLEDDENTLRVTLPHKKNEAFGKLEEFKSRSRHIAIQFGDAGSIIHIDIRDLRELLISHGFALIPLEEAFVAVEENTGHSSKSQPPCA